MTPWCTTGHEFHPILATHTHTQQLQAPYHPFNNISRPLFRTTYNLLTWRYYAHRTKTFVSRQRGHIGGELSSSLAAGCHTSGTRHTLQRTCLGVAPGRHSHIRHRMVCQSTCCSSCCRSHPSTGNRKGNGCKGSKEANGFTKALYLSPLWGIINMSKKNMQC